MLNLPGGPWLAYLIGGLFIAAGLFLAISTIYRNGKCTEPATAHVCRIVEERSYDSETGGYSVAYYPVFQFFAKDGTLVEAKATVGRGSVKCQVNDTVELRYNPDKPEQIAVSKDIRIAVIGGFVFAAIGVGVLLLMALK